MKPFFHRKSERKRGVSIALGFNLYISEKKGIWLLRNPSCGARKNHRAIRLLDFFDRYASFRSLFPPQAAVAAPSCGARKNHRAVRLLDFFARCASFRSLFPPQAAVAKTAPAGSRRSGSILIITQNKISTP